MLVWWVCEGRRRDQHGEKLKHGVEYRVKVRHSPLAAFIFKRVSWGCSEILCKMLCLRRRNLSGGVVLLPRLNWGERESEVERSSVQTRAANCYQLAVLKLTAVRILRYRWVTYYYTEFSSSAPVCSLFWSRCLWELQSMTTQLAACLGKKNRFLELQQCLDAAHLGLCARHSLKIPKVTAESENCKMMQRRFS